VGGGQSRQHPLHIGPIFRIDTGIGKKLKRKKARGRKREFFLYISPFLSFWRAPLLLKKFCLVSNLFELSLALSQLPLFLGYDPWLPRHGSGLS
jgi:hypothetical protein